MGINERKDEQYTKTGAFRRKKRQYVWRQSGTHKGSEDTQILGFSALPPTPLNTPTQAHAMGGRRQTQDVKETKRINILQAGRRIRTRQDIYVPLFLSLSTQNLALQSLFRKCFQFISPRGLSSALTLTNTRLPCTCLSICYQFWAWCDLAKSISCS